MKHAGIPVVLLDRDIVGVDNVAGGVLPTDHLAAELLQPLTRIGMDLLSPSINPISAA